MGPHDTLQRRTPPVRIRNSASTEKLTYVNGTTDVDRPVHRVTKATPALRVRLRGGRPLRRRDDPARGSSTRPAAARSAASTRRGQLRSARRAAPRGRITRRGGQRRLRRRRNADRPRRLQRHGRPDAARQRRRGAMGLPDAWRSLATGSPGRLALQPLHAAPARPSWRRPRRPGQTATATVTARNGDGNPDPGRSVRYAIAGANPSAGTVTTGADGNARSRGPGRTSAPTR